MSFKSYAVDPVRPNEIHGKFPRLRLKWSCRCGQRNDHPVPLPPGKHETFVCRACKRATIIGFETKYENPAKPEEATDVRAGASSEESTP